MHRRGFVFAAVVSVVGVACATASAPDTSGGGAEEPGGDASVNEDAGGNPYSVGDGGVTPKGDSGTFVPKDSGTGTTPTDSGATPPPPVDSGTTPPPVTLCTGTSSKHSIPESGGDKSYDDWCDFNAFNEVEFDCTQNSDCSSNYSSSYEPECCYKPPSGSACDSDYGSTSQCVPK